MSSGTKSIPYRNSLSKICNYHAICFLPARRKIAPIDFIDKYKATEIALLLPWVIFCDCLTLLVLLPRDTQPFRDRESKRQQQRVTLARRAP